ncbi:protein KHNYN [Microcaecilia unicolor]|uniref:NEDD4-binding protein 1 n=1 Tax=Microcaecilia unicolor TaxID=1415580 RepID=A0A6P7WG37_9AMPH|nr:protein KHNYN-like [Microcaecilia unicolor]
MSRAEGWILDEFAICQEWEGAVREERRRIEKLFGVELNILGVLGRVQGPQEIQGAQQIWLQLLGLRDNLKKAKDYIKGLCNPEMTEPFSYPKDMHCIFLGATGLFLNCLVSGTSASISLMAHGSLQISGLTESVVMAHSRIHEFVERYQKNTRLPEEQEARVKREFKDLVEAYIDKHSMDLLILPNSVKEELLNLVREVALHKDETNLAQKGQNPNSGLLDLPEPWKKPEISDVCPRNLVRSQEGGQRRHVLQKRASRPMPDYSDSSPDELLGCPEPRNHQKRTETSGEPGVAQIYLYNEDNLQRHGVTPAQGDMLDQNGQLQKLPGLRKAVSQSNGEEEKEEEDEELGQSVLTSSGTEKEFSMLLNFFKTMGYEERMVKKVLAEEGVQEPSEILDRLQVEQEPPRPGSPTLGSHSGERMETAGADNEYLLEVLKSAIENCGYSPSEITDLKEGSLATLLRKLNEGRAPGTEDPKITERRYHGSPTRRVPCGPPNHRPWTVVVPEVSVPKDDSSLTSGSSTPGIRQASMQEPVEDVCPATAGTWAVAEGGSSSGQQAVSVVTGVQRFNEAMQTPFQLNLRNKPGKDNLRHIIIDGSNVAMVHGLNQFFSCRGIALAVQYFWDRGHRELTVLVPQWRMKKDSKAKEQHFLTELNAVGLLSFTPSRVVEGRRITPYDDRFLLQLAEQTDGGVILTNDNLRDMAQESGKWKVIIKERLLQFTFAGDIFLVPDDPLGRNGPGLDQFLSKTQKPRSRAGKSHTFAGQRNPVQVPPHPAPRTEILTPWNQKVGSGTEDSRAAEGGERPRLRHETLRLRKKLLDIFAEQEVKVDFILQVEPYTQDLNKLSELILNLRV